MAAYLIDLDGVFFEYGTMVPTIGAVDAVRRLKTDGHQVFFITRRQYENNNDPSMNLYRTEQILKDLSVSYDMIIGGVESPRILINDEGCSAINHQRNNALRHEDISQEK